MSPRQQHSNRADRDLDIVVFGATGFVGRLLAEYLAAHSPAGTRIALAGRSRERLESVRDQLGPAASGWPIKVADAGSRRSMSELANSTRVVATTVGPYAKFGMPLVGACAKAGTHYADLTGEVLFVHRSIDAYHDTACETGARIVHSCGFDSIPSDIGVWRAHAQAQADGAGSLTDTALIVRTMKGGFSGGTIDSMRNQLAEVGSDRSLSKIVADPYALSPDRAAEPDGGDERDSFAISYDSDLGGWVGPFVMASYNTRIVRRSNALLGWQYGRRFRYRELMGFGSGVTAPATAATMTVGLGAFAAAMGFGPTRKLLDRMLPAPGEGPSAEQRRKGRFRVDIHARTTDGARYVSTVAAQGDPGYAATSVMLGESALSLALDEVHLPDRAGVLTPATAMGGALADRLEAADFNLRVRSVGEGD
ncbi:MAG: saccharopine dehydrogenase NADP-binding domain-containing protein [Actinomycetes bacterium]